MQESIHGARIEERDALEATTRACWRASFQNCDETLGFWVGGSDYAVGAFVKDVRSDSLMIRGLSGRVGSLRLGWWGTVQEGTT